MPEVVLTSWNNFANSVRNWQCYIGDLRNYKQYSTHNEDGIFDCVEGMLDNIEEKIWEADGVLDLRDESISILDAIS